MAGACGARHGRSRYRLPVRADSRSSCAADGGLRDGRLADSGSPVGRAGYRSAQDLLLFVSIAFSCSCAAVSGTVGGNADRVVSHAHRFADRGAVRRHSSSSWSWSRFSPKDRGSTATPSSLERTSERIVEQIVDISPGGGLGQCSASSARVADEDFTGCGVTGRW